MHFKKFVALLLSAALALAVFAGCGSESLLQLLLDLLQAQYQNITITAEDDLEATLRQAVRENDSMEEIDNALQDALLPTIQFQSLRSARAGDQAFDLVFRTGTDTEAMARQTYTDWNTVLGSLPSNGQYLADLATLKAENGYYILVNITVKKGSGSGSGSDSSSDPDDPSTPTVDRGYRDNHNNTYTVYRNEGLKNLFEDYPKETFQGKTIGLESDLTCTVDKALVEATSDHPTAAFNGTLKSEDPDNPATIKISGDYMFTKIDGDGVVQDLQIEVTGNISGSLTIGAITGENMGEISNCVVDLNGHTIKGTTVGGVAGKNSTKDATVRGCAVKGGIIEGNAGYGNVGGLVGQNSGEVMSSYSTSTVKSADQSTNVGGLVGTNATGDSLVRGCYFAGTVTAAANSNAGGVVGQNGADNTSSTMDPWVPGFGKISGGVFNCYWHANIDVGIGNWAEETNTEKTGYTEAYGTEAKNKVDTSEEWVAAKNILNRYSDISGRQFSGDMGNPQLN